MKGRLLAATVYLLFVPVLTASAQPPLVPPPPAPWPDGGAYGPPVGPPMGPPPGLYPHPQMPPHLLPPGPFPEPGLHPFPPPGAIVPEPGFHAFERPLLLRDYDWMYLDAPRPRELAVNDIITIIVKEQARMSVDSRYNRNRTGVFRAELRDFLRLDDDGNLANAAGNKPTIDGNLIARLQSIGQVAEREEMIYRIAATIVDIKPNGTLELSAKKTIVANSDLLEYELSGTLRAEDVQRDNTALSENIANLQIRKKQKGKVFDATKRAWGLRLYDLLFPF